MAIRFLYYAIGYILFPLASYLLGSVSFGMIIGKLKGLDIRSQGSGNIGATNAGRVLGKKAGMFVFLLDLLKGAVPALVFALVAQSIIDVPSWKLLGAIYGACAIFGHVFPVFYDYKGGKAVATSFGVFLVLAPFQTLTALAMWGMILGFSRYVSLSSILAACTLFIMVFLAYPSQPPAPLAKSPQQGEVGFIERLSESFQSAATNSTRKLYPIPDGMGTREKGIMVIVSALAAGLVLVRHKDNISRLREGTESKLFMTDSERRAAQAQKRFGKGQPRKSKSSRISRASATGGARTFQRKITTPQAKDFADDAPEMTDADAPAADAKDDDSPAIEEVQPEDNMDTQVPVEDISDEGVELLELEEISSSETREFDSAGDTDKTPHPSDDYLAELSDDDEGDTDEEVDKK